MGRKRTGTVSESAELLSTMLTQYRGTPAEPRLKLLLTLCDQPDLKTEALVGIVGQSERTIRRWWKSYRQGGLSNFLNHAIPQVSYCAEEPTPYFDPGAQSLVKLLNSLPTTSDFPDWCSGLETVLGRYLGVDIRVDFGGAQD